MVEIGDLGDDSLINDWELMKFVETVSSRYGVNYNELCAMLGRNWEHVKWFMRKNPDWGIFFSEVVNYSGSHEELLRKFRELMNHESR